MYDNMTIEMCQRSWSFGIDMVCDGDYKQVKAEDNGDE